MYDTNVYAVVTDNASVINTMGKEISSPAWHSNFSSHTGYLLAKSMVDEKKYDENVERCYS